MSKSAQNFIDLCLQGEIVDLNQIDDFIDAWHDGDSEQTLHEFLGLTLYVMHGPDVSPSLSLSEI